MSSLQDNKNFDIFFQSVYGERWPAIRQALSKAPIQVLRANLFQKPETIGFMPFEKLKNCYLRPENHVLTKNNDNFYEFYAMDPASVLVASALECQPDENILDMCAAPGGKSLILAESMGSGSLISNEMSDGRRERLLRVFHEYIPKEKRLFITVKGLDGNQYGLRFKDEFDRVLADVPCSGERHLLENPKEFALWTKRRSENLAIRQYSLLSSAWLAVKTGGRIVYSTCSISPIENDQVVAKLVKKRQVEILRPEYLDDYNFLEKTEYGYQVLPDSCGFGPMYFSVIEK